MTNRVVSVNNEINAMVTETNLNGSDKTIKLVSNSKNRIHSVSGFVQFYSRGKPTHRTDFRGVVPWEGSTGKDVSGVDQQWVINILSMSSFDRDLHLRGGADLSAVLGSVKLVAFDSETTVFSYTGIRDVYAHFAVPDASGSVNTGVFVVGSAFGQSLTKGDPRYELLFAEYLA